MVERLIILSLSFFSALIYAGADVSILKVDKPMAVEKTTATEQKKGLDGKLLPIDGPLQVLGYDKNKEPLTFGVENSTKADQNTNNTTVLPDLFNTKLPPSFSVQGRFIEKENMSKEGSDIEGAAVRFIFVQ